MIVHRILRGQNIKCHELSGHGCPNQIPTGGTSTDAEFYRPSCAGTRVLTACRTTGERLLGRVMQTIYLESVTAVEWNSITPRGEGFNTETSIRSSLVKPWSSL